MRESTEADVVGVAQAEMAVGVIRDQVAMMGANDMELPAINDLMAKIRHHEIEPAEAIRQAGQILAAKADYH